ncbi:SIR2 family protein [Streptomyces sp. SID13031]|uniref:SIR2 family NAD-dependent protein deacylase n=1 Tax=Streptomyces sp. SID13031 TaxID=2706046 RepID=UPI0013C8D662|nr:SIR2 family protein [Streptomyces sp. SID13031]NEA31754.1 SIR2 family protein [Streptomyces sp. SID13031]
MPGTPAWNATPHGRRSISEVAAAIKSRDGASRLVLLIGAGVDQALSSRPGWTDLLDEVAGGPDGATLDRSHLKDVAKQWPMEAAEAIRLTLGPVGYRENISRAIPARTNEAVAETAIAQALTAVVCSGVRLIVSLNYTDDLVAVLRLNLPARLTVRVIDRTELPAWRLGHLFEPASGEVNVVKLHGSIAATDGVSGSPVVLSRSTYDAVLTSDSPYRKILSRLFEDYVVLSVGVSWSDVALRDAAAQARRELPVARPMHYATLPQEGTSRDWWEQRALTASYGVRPLYYDKYQQVPELLQSIAEVASGKLTPAPGASLEIVASWLRRVGDYESRQQSIWFAEEPTGVPNWKITSDAILRACRAEVIDPDTWLNCARVEGHLRHFVWFWLHPAERSAARMRVWSAIARSWRSLPSEAQKAFWDEERLIGSLEWDNRESETPDRAVLEFAYGAHEVMGAASPEPAVREWAQRLAQLGRHAPQSIAARRSQLAGIVWSQPPTQRLLEGMQEAYWEGMEAKVAHDLAENRIKLEIVNRPDTTLRDWPDSVRSALHEQCDHVRELARVAGSTRREAGAIVLGSFFISPDRAQSDLIAAYRRLTDLGGGRSEPTASWSVIVGLIAAVSDQARDVPSERLLPSLCEWLLDKCGKVPLDGSILTTVEQNYSVFWRTFHPRAADLAVEVARLLQGRAIN